MSFDVNRLRRSDWITGGGAVAFFVFLFFFNWYGGSYKGTVPLGGSFGTSASSTGWDTFTNSRWIWLITIIVALAAVVLVAGQRKLDLPAKPGAIVCGLGALSTLLIFYRIVHHPTGGASFGGASFSYGIKFGIWLGLIAAAAITYGGYLMMNHEDGISSPDGGHRFTDTAAGGAPPSTQSGPAGEAPPLSSPSSVEAPQPPSSTSASDPPLPPPPPSS